MEEERPFFREVLSIAVPAAFQSMLQSSFSMVDQMMIGQLGSISIAGVGLAGKFASVFSVIVSAVGAVAGIMISQYIGKKNQSEIRRSFFVNLVIAVMTAGVFVFLSITFPAQVMGFYTKDVAVIQEASGYLKIIAGTFLPLAGGTMLSVLFRCMGKAVLPLYASIGAAIVNTGLNYILIFGKAGFPALGAEGAAIATLVSQMVNVTFMLWMLRGQNYLRKAQDDSLEEYQRFQWRQYVVILFPVLLCEGMWSLGENVYAGIYGHIGTKAMAAMTLINPVQGLMTGALCGISQAAGVLVGRRLGSGEQEKAYQESKKLMGYGWAGALILSAVILFIRPYYVGIYQVEPYVKHVTSQILLAYVLIAPFKIQNMILGGGIIRSGGRTKYILAIDMAGTWGIGVPLGFLAAFVLKLPVPYVYFILSLEECVRFAISMDVFRKRKWMQRLKG